MMTHSNSISEQSAAANGAAGPVRVWLRSVGYAAALWAIPFLVSVPFFNRSGELQIDIFAFKSLMLVVGSLTGVILLLRHLGRSFAERAPEILATGGFWRFGLATGTLWLAINWALDFLILLPLSGQSPMEYMLSIGAGYLAMPITATGLALAMAGAGRAAREASTAKS